MLLADELSLSDRGRNTVVTISTRMFRVTSTGAFIHQADSGAHLIPAFFHNEWLIFAFLSVMSPDLTLSHKLSRRNVSGDFGSAAYAFLYRSNMVGNLLVIVFPFFGFE